MVISPFPLFISKYSWNLFINKKSIFLALFLYILLYKWLAWSSHAYLPLSNIYLYALTSENASMQKVIVQHFLHWEKNTSNTSFFRPILHHFSQLYIVWFLSSIYIIISLSHYRNANSSFVPTQSAEVYPTKRYSSKQKHLELFSLTFS